MREGRIPRWRDRFVHAFGKEPITRWRGGRPHVARICFCQPRECKENDMTTLTTKPIVFVVDDDITVRESLKASIEALGWQAETFPSAKAFLARPRTRVPSCLVLDVFLPDF